MSYEFHCINDPCGPFDDGRELEPIEEGEMERDVRAGGATFAESQERLARALDMLTAMAAWEGESDDTNKRTNK